MNFFKFYIGDYQRDTNRLSWEQDLAYRRLLDEYYATGQPLPTDRAECYNAARCMTPEQQLAVDMVLERYFWIQNDEYHNTKADRLIEEAAKYTDSQRTKGKKGGRPRKSPGLTGAKPVLKPGINRGKANHSHSLTPQPEYTEVAESVGRKEKKEKQLLPSTDRPTNQKTYQATIADARALVQLMFDATGQAEKDRTALKWLSQARRAKTYEQIDKLLRTKLKKTKPENNAWFESVLKNQFGLSPDEIADQRAEIIRDLRKAILLPEPNQRSMAVSRCHERAAALGISVMNVI